jgi:hypothetical protein
MALKSERLYEQCGFGARRNPRIGERPGQEIRPVEMEIEDG